jgi:hypothetical protein
VRRRVVVGDALRHALLAHLDVVHTGRFNGSALSSTEQHFFLFKPLMMFSTCSAKLEKQ